MLSAYVVMDGVLQVKIAKNEQCIPKKKKQIGLDKKERECRIHLGARNEFMEIQCSWVGDADAYTWCKKNAMNGNSVFRGW